ncbi:MAG: hypothetical protein KJ578_12945 [Bacteroidetes bacterium]|nr:hypothetical protein [Bacteroidota bacterium]MBU1579164.1 hypothetical protein [Bacteroidota bacterium]MBU2465713.1 hypothetical protein [Bacteroidota bacterium]MBU2558676.1 hypothetical protein [Bacteroidota bacterium]
MKRILIIAGGILVFLSVVPLIQFVFDYNELSDYGRGYIWGNVLLLLIGSLLLFAGIKKKRKSPTDEQ